MPSSTEPTTHSDGPYAAVGELAQRMGIRFHQLSAEESIASMPVHGNRQPFGLLHGGAHVVLAETLGSLSANEWAGPERVALGIEIGASHSGAVSEGRVVGTCRAISLGSSLTVHEIAIADEKGRRLSTVRMTNLLTQRRE